MRILEREQEETEVYFVTSSVSRHVEMLPVMDRVAHSARSQTAANTAPYAAPCDTVRQDLADATRPDVSILIYDLRASGVVRNALRIARQAAVAGLRVDLVVVQAQGDFRPSDHPRIKLVSLMPEASANRFLGTLAAAKHLRAYLTQQRPRVLFSAGNHIHPLAAMACFRLEDAPRLIMRASNDLSHVRRSGWQALASHVLAASARPLLRAMFTMADRIVSVSDELAGSLGSRLGLPQAEIDVIPNGIDVNRIGQLSRQEVMHPWLAPGQPPVILGVGRLHRQKNFPLLLRAFALLRRRQPARLMILGAGTPQALKELQDLADQLGIADDVAFMGYVENPFAYLRRAALYVLSSSWEGMSNSLLEAMACGCPVVATRCPTGTIEVLADGEYGPLVEIENDEALADAMRCRLDQPRQSARLMARAQDYDLFRALDAYTHLLVSEARPAEAAPALSAAA